MRLVDLRSDVESLTQSLVRSRYLALSGQTAGLDLTPAFREYPRVATWEAFGLVHEAIGRAEGKRASRLRALLHHVYRLIEDASTTRAIASRHGAATATIGGTEPGETVPVRVALDEVGLVGNREKRALFERRSVEALAAEDQVVSRELESLHSVAQKGGFGSVASAHAGLGNMDLSALATDAESFLQSTAPMYEDVLSWWMRRATGLRLFPHGAERHDLMYALALTELEGLFPRGESLIALSERVASMGLSPRADGRLRIDSDRRVTKTPEPFVAPIDPPSEVVAVFRPRRGYIGARDLLRSFGTAQHYAHIDPARPFEDRAMGDRAVPLAMGELFALWLLDEKWLRRVLEAELPDLLRILSLVELARLRLDAARFLHSMQIEREGLGAGRGARYAERLSHVMLVAWPEGLWLHDADVRLCVTDALRGRALAISWAEHLREHFDEDWWRNPSTGAYLKKAFEQGQVESASELAKRLELGEMTLMRAAGWFERLLNR